MAAPVHYLISEAKRELREEFAEELESLKKRIDELEKLIAKQNRARYTGGL